jgi:hypothetical protein
VDPLKALDLLGKARQDRNSRLPRFLSGPAHSAVLPEDGTLHTTAWHVQPGSADLAALRSILEVAVREGLRLVIHADPDHRAEIEAVLPRDSRSHVTFAASIQLAAPFIEDYGEFTEEGEVVVPGRAQLSLGDPFPVREMVLRTRLERYYPSARIPREVRGDDAVEKYIKAHYPRAAFPALGKAEHVDESHVMPMLAVASGAPLRVGFGVWEGGN